MQNSNVSYNGNGKSHTDKTGSQTMPMVSNTFSSAPAGSSTTEVINQVDRDAALNLIDQLRNQLPNLRDLTADERRVLLGMGDKNRAFTGKVLEVVQRNPDFLPRSFDIDRLEQNLVAFDRFSSILMALTQLRDLVDATAIAIGSEAYEDALAVYRYAKASGQGASMDAMMGEMAQRFRKSKKKKGEDDKPEAAE